MGTIDGNFDIKYLQSSFATTCHVISLYTPADKFGGAACASITHVASREEAVDNVQKAIEFHLSFIAKKRRDRWKINEKMKNPTTDSAPEKWTADPGALYDNDNDVVRMTVIGGTTDDHDRHSAKVSLGVFDTIARQMAKRRKNQNIFLENVCVLEDNDKPLEFLGEKRKGGVVSGLRVCVSNGSVWAYSGGQMDVCGTRYCKDPTGGARKARIWSASMDGDKKVKDVMAHVLVPVGDGKLILSSPTYLAKPRPYYRAIHGAINPEMDLKNFSTSYWCEERPAFTDNLKQSLGFVIENDGKVVGGNYDYAGGGEWNQLLDMNIANDKEEKENNKK